MQALILTDLQQWMFRLPERQAQLPGLLIAIERLIEKFQAERAPIYDVRTVHKADRSTWSRLMLKYDYPCLLEGTADAAAIEGYSKPLEAREVIKTQQSAFLFTDFDDQLKKEGVTGLVIVGVFIDGCVGLTAAEAAQRGYEVTLVEDAIGHTNASLRGPLFRWLQEDFEMNVAARAAEVLVD